jgi:hypothetical protein
MNEVIRNQECQRYRQEDDYFLGDGRNSKNKNAGDQENPEKSFEIFS